MLTNHLKTRERASFSSKDNMSMGYEKIDNLFLITIIVNILFPKAGIKVASIPLTLGNVLFLLLIMKYILISVNKQKIILSKVELAIFFEIFFWGIRLGILLFDGRNSFADICGYLIPLCVFPIMYFIFPCYIRTEGQLRNLIHIIEKCVLLLMIYAMLQYIFGIDKVQIPGITVNYSDYIANPTGWYTKKYNAIGNGSKIVSTYQNGNIFGVNLLLLFPVAYHAPKANVWQKALYISLFVASAFFTGSRTVYIGCLVYVIIMIAHLTRKLKIKKESLKTFLLSVCCIGIGGWIWLGNDSSALITRLVNSLNLDTFLSGSGRTEAAFQYFQWLFNKAGLGNILLGGYGWNYDGGAYEMTYLCVFVLGGLIGLVIFICPFIMIRKIFTNKRVTMPNYIAIGVAEGLIIYAVSAFIEGAYWLTPTALNVWMMLSIASIRLETRIK